MIISRAPKRAGCWHILISSSTASRSWQRNQISPIQYLAPNDSTAWTANNAVAATAPKSPQPNAPPQMYAAKIYIHAGSYQLLAPESQAVSSELKISTAFLGLVTALGPRRGVLGFCWLWTLATQIILAPVGRADVVALCASEIQTWIVLWNTAAPGKN